MAENQTIYSFDSTFSVSGELFETEKYRELYRAFSDGKVISRGAGVSYPLASAGEGVRSVVSTHFNRILEFNPETGVVRVESGVSLGQLLKFLSEQGWWLPVIPGHPSITIGGCVACNVHGKSQYHSGLFGDSVREIEIFHPKTGKIRCVAGSEIFNLTVGGFGLTGHMLNIEIQCKKLKGRSLSKSSVPSENLLESIELMMKEKDNYDHVYSWNDLNRKGSRFGAGFVYCEKFESEPIQDIEKFGSLVPPVRNSLIDRMLSIGLKNRISMAYSFKEKVSPRKCRTGILAGAFPINGKEIYHRLFGPAGLLESQIIIPQNELQSVVAKLAQAITEFNEPVSLGSLKIFRGNQKYLNYISNGVCLALNVPNTANALKFFEKIDQICESYGCLPNISKDSRLNSKVIESTYSKYDDFKKEINNFDPSKSVTSALRERLNL